MRDLMAPTTPAATRYNAARWVLEHAGHKIADESADLDSNPSFEEMDAEELSQAVASGMQALRDLAEQLQDHHVVDGQARRLQTVGPPAPSEMETDTDFLQ
ncbi:hypothetical protein ABE957_10370 [Halomonas sp. CS7]|uniref:Uncharacterized protein n=1 Tax=Halomonas pelophila TaxID=3151122 RepID=A0ABV1N6M5_9GAMM